jgi:hypothetical protein
MPFFIGRFDLDSAQIEGSWHRLATYPAGQFQGPSRNVLWQQLKDLIPPQSRVFGETPWKNYATLIIFEPSFGGGSALEHQNSTGIYPASSAPPCSPRSPQRDPCLEREAAGELCLSHTRQPTALLWVSRESPTTTPIWRPAGGIIDSTVFLNVTEGKREHTDQTVPIALEDSHRLDRAGRWDHDIYYDKGRRHSCSTS